MQSLLEARRSSFPTELCAAGTLKSLFFLVPLCGLIFAPLRVPAQQPASPASELPAAPLPTGSSQIQALGALSGFVTDTDGAAIPGAILTLEFQSSPVRRTTVSSPDGAYTFPDVSAGSVSLTVSAIGFASTTLPSVGIQPGQHLELPPIPLQLAAVDTTVQAISQHEMAEQQIKVQEEQRLFGVVPNFYVSYTWNAVPLSSGQKFQLAARSLIDPFTFIGTGISAGIEQSQNTYPGYGLGASGYAKRFSAAYGDNLVGTMVGGAILPSLLHQDPRYFYKGTGSVPTRAAYALSTIFRARGDNGRWQPNYSYLIGGLAAGAISNAYYPASDRGAQTTVDNFLIDLGSDMIQSLIQEFVLRKLTRHPPPAVLEHQ